MTAQKPPFEVREGDMLYVSIPEMKISPPGSYSSITIGGASYSRKLREGDSIEQEYRKIFDWLKLKVESDGRDRVRDFVQELTAAKQR